MVETDQQLKHLTMKKSQFMVYKVRTLFTLMYVLYSTVADWIFHGNTTEVVGSYRTRVLVLPESEEMYRVDFRVLKAGVQFSTDFIVFGHTAGL